MLSLFIYYCVANLLASSIAILLIGKFRPKRYAAWEEAMEDWIEESGYWVVCPAFVILTALFFIPLAIVSVFRERKK